MKYIQLTQGRRAIVDDDLYEWLNGWSWYYKKRTTGKGGDAARTLNGTLGRNKTVRMQNLILPVAPGYVTDHIDMDPLNNQRDNLRIATGSQNARNTGLRESNTSGAKGVYWHKRDKAWRVQLMYGGKKKYIGNYKTIEEARDAYKEAVTKYHGRFART